LELHVRRIHECTSNESLLPIKPFTAEQMASINKLKNPSHTNNSSKTNQGNHTKENKIAKKKENKKEIKTHGLTV
jgi:hypothetical protein